MRRDNFEPQRTRADGFGLTQDVDSSQIYGGIFGNMIEYGAEIKFDNTYIKWVSDVAYSLRLNHRKVNHSDFDLPSGSGSET